MSDKFFKTIYEIANPKHTHVCVIDMQNDFCDPKGAFSSIMENSNMMTETILNIVNFLDKCRKIDIKIDFFRHFFEVKDTPVIQELNWRNKVPRRLIRGTWGGEFFPLLKPHLKEPVFTKYRYSAMTNQKYIAFLKRQGVKTLILTGGTTNGCVETTARDAYMRGYHIIVPEDCVVARTLELHCQGLVSIDRYFGRVLSSSKLISVWEELKNH